MNQTPQTNPAIEHLDPNHLGPDQLNAYIDGELSSAEQQGIGQHLATCHACTLRVLSATQLKAATARAGHRFAPPPEALARLTAQLHSQSEPQSQPQPKPTARIYSMRPASIRPAAWAALAAAILLTISFLTWRQLRPTDTLAAELAAELLDQHLATLSSSATPQVISTDRHTVKPCSRAVSPSASTYPTPLPYHPTPPSKAQISPTSTANPLLCSSSPSTNTRSPSSLRNAPPAPRSLHCP